MKTKIRAWDGKRMMYKDIFDLNWYATEYIDENGSNCIRKMTPTDRLLITMFNTGIRDKNNKEIYEGDILHRHMNVFWKVVFKDSKLIAESLCDETGLYLDAIQFKEAEIIGNIYQNPELL